jgi:hypothetical protein
MIIEDQPSGWSACGENALFSPQAFLMVIKTLIIERNL